jgi:putative tricarboxylic transport membrane protein
MLISQGSLTIFYSNPLVSSIVTLALVMLLSPLWGTLKDVLRRREARRA